VVLSSLRRAKQLQRPLKRLRIVMQPMCLRSSVRYSARALRPSIKPLTRSTLAVSACHTVASGYANSEQPAGTGLSYIGVKPFRGVAI
jgi:hypothetical protein